MNQIEGYHYISCPVCGRHYKSLKRHLLMVHSWSIEEINSLDKINCDELTERITERNKRNVQKSWDNNRDKMLERVSRNKNRIQATKDACSTDEFKNKMSSIMVENWKNDEYRESTIAGMREAFNKEEYLAKRREFWKDKNYRSKINSNRRQCRIEFEGNELRSHWELNLAIILSENNIEYMYEKVIVPYKDSNGRNHNYISDFYLPDYNLILEVHPEILIDDVMIAKMEACKNHNYNFEFITNPNITDDELFKILDKYSMETDSNGMILQATLKR